MRTQKSLPAQNATGNWIKVVQRLPVRIQLDPAELRAHPLQIGLSMQVDVRTRDEGGSRLSGVGAMPYRTSYRTDVFRRHGEEADREIQRIIVQNRNGVGNPAPVGENVARQGNQVRQQPSFAQRDARAAGAGGS